MHDDQRYTVISADCHGGGEIREYRDYLPSQYHDEFDAWADGYVIGFADLLGDDGARNWDSDRRRRDLESDGVRRRGDLPEHDPAVLPELVARDPARRRRTRATLELRWVGPPGPQPLAGRLLRGRCRGAAPASRRSLLYDVEASVAEVRRAKESGLTGGVLLPGAPPGVGPAPAAPPALRAALGGLRGARRAGQPPRRRRRTAARRLARGHRDVPARGHVVVAPGAHQPHRRWRARTAPEPAAGVHRARHGVGARPVAGARLLLRPHAQRDRLAGA